MKKTGKEEEKEKMEAKKKMHEIGENLKAVSVSQSFSYLAMY